MLDLIRDIILATDLAHHLKIMKDLENMAESNVFLLNNNLSSLSFGLHGYKS